MKRLLYIKLFVLLCLTTVVPAQTNFINVHTRDGKTYSVATGNIRKLTFRDTTSSVTEKNDKTISEIENPGKITGFPNPFSKDITIRFENKASAALEINIFNGTGEKVFHLSTTPQTTGFYQFTWNGKNAIGFDLPEGSYFCVVRSGTDLLTKKIIYLK